MILIVSHEQDPHAVRVLDKLAAAGRQALLLNLADFPDRACLSIDYSEKSRPRIDVVHDASGVHALSDVRSVWWRRPQAPDLAGVRDPQENLFTANEWNEAINGLWQLLDARWMNDPIRDEAASRKARQLRVAAEVGLKVPRTLITSDPRRARAFVDAEGIGQVVYKTFSCTYAVWRETRLLHAEDLAQLDAVRVAPVIFQQYIPAECDLRVTALGETLFPAAIRSAPNPDSIDFRMSVGDADLRPEVLPPDIVEKLLALQKRLGLVYGAIDLRRTPAGEYYFFEVNTAGEFLFIEDRTGQPIAQAIADWLCGAIQPSGQ